MCGIAGTIGPLGDAARADVSRMLDALIHRGPDQDGVWASPGSTGVVIGQRRLSILDLSEAGRQPMIHAGTGVAMVYNGECYNFLDIRQELEALGHRFVSQSDSEVVLIAYVQWGAAAIARLRGMFAIALWDPRDQTLLLVRDRLGIKPLYYTIRDGRLLFASELRALLSPDRRQRQIDRQGLSAFLWHGFVPGPGTLVAGISLLGAGRLMRVSSEGRVLGTETYWRLPRGEASADARHGIERFEAELEKTVGMHLVSDVPLGVFLSGGVDSSVVAAMARRRSSAPIVTFNVRFDEARFDESAYARDVAARLGTEHRELVLTEQRFASQLEAAVGCIDQPTFDALNTYFVSRAVREAGVKVALAGTGGDELVGGYASFRELPKVARVAQLLGVLPNRLKSSLARTLVSLRSGEKGELHPQTRWGKLADMLATGGDLVPVYQVGYAMFTRETHETLMLAPAPGMDWGLRTEQLAELRALVSGQSDLNAISLLEISSFLGERLLRDTDFASMAVSLETRVPFLDHVLIETVAALPDAARFSPLGQKSLLKHAVRQQLPETLFDRPKAGFELPLGMWCRGALAARLEETFTDVNLATAIGLNAETVGRIWRAFRTGGEGQYWSRVWSLYVLMNWCRRHDVYAA